VRTTPRNACRALLLTCVVALVAGCGGGDDTPATTTKATPAPEAQVLATWRAAASAAAHGSGTAFCAQVAPAGKAKLTEQTSLPCEATVQLLASQLTPADRAAVTGAKVTSVTVTGTTAVVRYESNKRLARYGFTGRTELTKSGDRWLLLGI
jgi:membrane-bound lytic murein transglycosylase